MGIQSLRSERKKKKTSLLDIIYFQPKGEMSTLGTVKLKFPLLLSMSCALKNDRLATVNDTLKIKFLADNGGDLSSEITEASSMTGVELLLVADHFV